MLIGFAVLSLVVWVLVQDLAFLGGLGTDPGSMIPFILLASAGYLALTRPAVAAAPTTAGAGVDDALSGAGGGVGREPGKPVRWRPAGSMRRVVVASAWSVAALGGVGLIVLGAVPMAVAQASPNADPILAEAIAGPVTAVRYPAPGFALVDQAGATVTLAGLRGRVVVLAFVDPACAANCPPVGREFRQASDLLGTSARSVDFTGIVLGRSAGSRSVAAMLAFDRSEGLDGVSGWRYLTGAPAELDRVWRAYQATGRSGSASGPTAGTGATSGGVVYVIDRSGSVRQRIELGTGPGTAATTSSFAVLFADTARAALVGR